MMLQPKLEAFGGKDESALVLSHTLVDTDCGVVGNLFQTVDRPPDRFVAKGRVRDLVQPLLQTKSWNSEVLDRVRRRRRTEEVERHQRPALR